MCTVPETIVPKNMMEEPRWLRYEIMGRLNGGDKAYIYPTIASDWVMLTGSQTRPVHKIQIAPPLLHSRSKSHCRRQRSRKSFLAFNCAGFCRTRGGTSLRLVSVATIPLL
ncbi:hypothetical protein ARMSODRAFT_163650 [Armillaria solidipes]|uniref:Uncharacterized protein n=1 Tax=Armillaria solidipes TaxID=1076256 RepID=A0A2H3BIF3_9AGAR|nr:hypothetical protein ARMSODRAFT_163650 [Armillaria solidipes]